MRPEEEDIARLLKKSLPSAQQEQEVGKRVFYRLLLAQTETSVASTPGDDEDDPRWKSRSWFSMAVALTAAVAALLFIVVLTSGLWRTGGNLAHNEPSADPNRSGEAVWVTDSDGRMLVLPDGSQVEMRAHSQLRVGHSGDGLRVRLNAGSIIVMAAKQRAGHLYVETKDAIVSVVGTVFVVTVEQAGSRVGVFEGVVSLQYGGISQKLFPGQQAATNPAMDPVPLEVQVSWSRNLASLLALLQPSVPRTQPAVAAVAPLGPTQSKPEAAQQNTEGDSLPVTGTAINGGAARLGQRSGEAEREMEQALISREPVADLFFRTETNYFQLNKAEYFVPVTLKIPGNQLAGSENAKRIAIDIAGEVTDDYGIHRDYLRDAIDVQLSDETARELPTRQIAYEARFTLLPGRYSMKFLVRDGLTGRIGTYQTDFAIPNLAKADKNIPISSVVLSSELVNLDGAQPSAADPLVIEGKKLIPNLTRTFSKRRDLIVSLQAYEPGATATTPLTAFVTIYRGQTKVFETSPVIAKDDVGRVLKTLPVKLRVPLTSLPAGAYECQVTVLDPATQKTAVWRSPINVVN